MALKHLNVFSLTTNSSLAQQNENMNDEIKMKENAGDVGGLDWNTLSLEQMVEHLRKKYVFISSADAKCIHHLIEFYDKRK